MRPPSPIARLAAVLVAALTPVIAGAEAPPTLLDLAKLDLSLFDSSTLNTANVLNQGALYIEPSVRFGKVFFPSTRFARMNLAARFVLTRTFTGYDDSSVAPDADLGFAPRCSNLGTSSNGTIDPESVKRCETSAAYRTTLADTWVTLGAPGLWTVPKVDVGVNPSLRLVLPTSLTSQYATRLFAVTGLVNAGRTFLGGQLNVSGTLGFTKYVHESTSPGVRGGAAPMSDGPVTANYRASELGRSVSDFYSDPARAGSGGLNPDLGFTQMVGLDWMPSFAPDFSLNVAQFWLHLFAYEAKQCQVVVAGAAYDVCAAADRVAKNSNGIGTSPGRAVTDLQLFMVYANYQVNPRMGLTLGWSTYGPQRRPDNTSRQPFVSVDYNAFSSVSIGAYVSLGRAGGGAQAPGLAVGAAAAEDDMKKATAPKDNAAGVKPAPAPPVAPVDTDGDGVDDAQDKCPAAPETKNGFEDGDGCPDEAPGGVAEQP